MHQRPATHPRSGPSCVCQWCLQQLFHHGELDHRALWATCWEGDPPRPTWGLFRPHLSVGQARDRPAMLRLLDGLRRSWQPVTFPVEGVGLIRREDPPDDVFRVMHRVPLGGTR